MSEREARTWAVAVFLSLAIHGALLWQVRTLEGDSGHGTPSPTVTRVRFNTTGAASSKVNAVAETKPRPKPVVEKAPAAAAMPVVEEETSEEPEASEQVASLAPLSGSEQSTAAVPGAASLSELRQAYQSQLMAHIEAKKFYPETARRRGVTGGVRVDFIVAPGGAAAALECGQGPTVLVQAACEAVRRAVPLPVPPPEIQLPFAVSFVIDYSLK